VRLGARVATIPSPPWTEALDDWLRRLRDEGLFMAEAARKMGRQKWDVGRRCRELGIASRPAPKGKVKPRLRTGPKPKAVTLPPLASLRDD